MPKYSYKCAECEQVSVFFHSMSEKKETCEKCSTSGLLTRIPSNFMLFEEKKEQKIGSVVKQSIDEFREDLNNEKEKLKNEFFEPDK
jgi:putative FmdB family regulatory protein